MKKRRSKIFREDFSSKTLCALSKFLSDLPLMRLRSNPVARARLNRPAPALIAPAITIKAGGKSLLSEKSTSTLQVGGAKAGAKLKIKTRATR